MDNTEVDVFLWKGSTIAGCNSYLSVRVRLGLHPTPAIADAFDGLVKAANALDEVSRLSGTQVM